MSVIDDLNAMTLSEIADLIENETVAGANVKERISTALKMLDNSYSEEEIYTGRTWINGDKIYRKVIAGTLTEENNNELNIPIDVARPFQTRQIIKKKLLPSYLSSNVFSSYFEEMDSATLNYPILTEFKIMLQYYTQSLLLSIQLKNTDITTGVASPAFELNPIFTGDFFVLVEYTKEDYATS